MFKLEVFLLCFCFLHANGDFGGTTNARTAITRECLNHASWGTCGFYQCLEDRFPCSSQGFAVNYGLHFCNKLVAAMGTFDALGQRWLNGTARCLTTNLLPVYNSDSTRCSDIFDRGGDVMLQCNTRTDPDGTEFCDFARDNFEAYRRVMGFSEIMRIVRLQRPSLISSFVLEAGRCRVTRLHSDLASMFGEARNVFDSFASSLRNRWNSIWE